MKAQPTFILAFLLLPLNNFPAFSTPLSNDCDPDREFLYALMEEKFIFFERLLYFENQPQEERREILQRSTKEIAFMEQLTGIVSIKKQGHREDKIFIHEKDYIAWTNWYFKHKPFVVWDEYSKKILFKKP